MRTRGEGGAVNAELLVKKDMGNTPVNSFEKLTNFQVINGVDCQANFNEHLVQLDLRPRVQLSEVELCCRSQLLA